MSYAQEQVIETSESLNGVGGWLKFFIVINLYISPAYFVLQSLLALVGFVALADENPNLLFIGFVEIAIGGFLIWKWIEIARNLRDIQPGVIRKAKTWLGLSLAVRFCMIPLDFAAGLDADDVMVAAVKSVVIGLLGFVIWYSYFNSSKRVKATYPDWSEQ
jgi:hypothetical protein